MKLYDYFCQCTRKNGIVVGAVEKDMKGPLFPTIAVHSQNEEYARHQTFIPFDTSSAYTMCILTI